MPLTVVQVLPALDAGGVERGTLEVAAELVRRGHRSIVVSGGGGLADQLVREGSEHVTLPVGKKSLLTLRLVPALRRLLLARGASVLHARSRLPAWISYLAWRGIEPENRPRFVTTVHGPYTVNRYSGIMVRGERVIAISGFIRDYILKNYPETDPAKIEVIHRGVDPDQFPYGHRPSTRWLEAWRAENPRLDGKFIVTLPARLTRWKGQEDFIDMVGMALSGGLPVHGLLVGGHHPRRTRFLGQLKARAQALGLTDHISFLGHRNDIREILAISDVVCSLAREPEAFGRSALEALCLGTPVIAYDHGGAAEILAEIFPTGRIAPLDTRGAVLRLNEFYESPPVVPQRNPFTLRRMLDQTIRLYEELCRPAPAAG